MRTITPISLFTMTLLTAATAPAASAQSMQIYTVAQGVTCGLEWNSAAGTVDTIGSAEHIAKFDCNGSADTFELRGSELLTTISGAQCALQWDGDAGEPSNLSSHEYLAKFDCSGDKGDPIWISGDKLYATISGKQCALEWHSQLGKVGGLAAHERVAKFDCGGGGDPMSFKGDGLAAVGAAFSSRDEVHQVRFELNNSSESTTVLNYTDEFEWLQTVGVSSETSETVGVNAKLTYESPDTFVGKFSAEIGVDWSETFSQMESSSETYRENSSYSWATNAPANSALFKKALFSIPYTEQVYENPASGERVQVRSLSSAVTTASYHETLSIPRRENGRLIPISKSELEQEWMAYLDDSGRRRVEEELQGWIQHGYVTEDGQPSASKSPGGQGGGRGGRGGGQGDGRGGPRGPRGGQSAQQQGGQH